MYSRREVRGTDPALDARANDCRTDSQHSHDAGPEHPNAVVPWSLLRLMRIRGLIVDGGTPRSGSRSEPTIRMTARHSSCLGAILP